MIYFKRFSSILFIAIATTISSLSWSTIILDSTYKKSGFDEAEALALEPQFASLMLLDYIPSTSCGSGAWIGNYDGHGYVLTAAHLFFPEPVKVSDYTYSTIDGTEYTGEEVYIHPSYYDEDKSKGKPGYDFAIIKLTTEVTTAGKQPKLYSGNAEVGKMITFLGYGDRGTGSKGQNISNEDYVPAGGVGLIEALLLPEKEDGVQAANYLEIWLPKEDGSIENPLKEDGITKPVSPLSGLIGSGDSGGPDWIKAKEGWAIAGVNSYGSGKAQYGDYSCFSRVSSVQEWIKEIMPDAEFIK